MPACAIKSESAGSSIDGKFAYHELFVNSIVRTSCNDFRQPNSQIGNMAEKQSDATIRPAWCIREWMDDLGLNQVEMINRTGWPKGSMSDIYNGKKTYNPALVSAAARALDIEEWELFMHPKRARAIRALENASAELSAQKSEVSDLVERVDARIRAKSAKSDKRAKTG